MKFLTEEERDEKIAIIESNDTRFDLDHLSKVLIEDHEAQGKLVAVGTQSLADLCSEEAVSFDDVPDIDLAELDEDFLKASGYSLGFEPPCFYEGGNGNLVVLLDFRKDKLESWVRQKWSERVAEA